MLVLKYRMVSSPEKTILTRRPMDLFQIGIGTLIVGAGSWGQYQRLQQKRLKKWSPPAQEETLASDSTQALRFALQRYSWRAPVNLEAAKALFWKELQTTVTPEELKSWLVTSL